MEVQLSVIVPIYNTRKYLKKCIDSILTQKYQDFELILVDDGSTDGCSRLCDRYERQNRRVRVIHKEHSGVTGARKAGLGYARGKYISYIDSDDWLDPEFYSFFYEYPEIDVDAVLLEGYYEEWKGKGTVMSTGLKEGHYGHRRLLEVLSKGLISCLWLKVFKRDILIKNMPLIDERVWMEEDMLLSYACLLDAEKVLIKKSYSYHYLLRQTSSSQHYSYRNVRNLCYFSENAKKIQSQKGTEFFNERWNWQIMYLLKKIIMHEFIAQSFFIAKPELDRIRVKLKPLDISGLLVGEKGKNGIGKWGKKEKVIFALYGRKLYRCLILYLNIIKIAEQVKLTIRQLDGIMGKIRKLMKKDEWRNG